MRHFYDTYYVVKCRYKSWHKKNNKSISDEMNEMVTKMANGALGIGCLTDKGQELLEKLKARRLEYAREKNQPAYQVCDNQTLLNMCERLPTDMAAFLQVEGISSFKALDFGNGFIKVINDFIEENPDEPIIDVKGKSAKTTGHATDKSGMSQAEDENRKKYSGSYNKKQLSDEGLELHRRLEKCRARLTREFKQPEETRVAWNKSLVDMCIKCPRDLASMKCVYGMKEVRVSRYGEQFLAVIDAFVEEFGNVSTIKGVKKPGQIEAVRN